MHRTGQVGLNAPGAGDREGQPAAGVEQGSQNVGQVAGAARLVYRQVTYLPDQAQLGGGQTGLSGGQLRPGGVRVRGDDKTPTPVVMRVRVHVEAAFAEPVPGVGWSEMGVE